MNTEISLYVRELEAILACNQSDGYLKKWAEDRLEELKYQVKSTPLPTKTLVTV